jgi:hypothetical protein
VPCTVAKRSAFMWSALWSWLLATSCGRPVVGGARAMRSHRHNVARDGAPIFVCEMQWAGSGTRDATEGA